jgi:hypothetical protein
MSDLFKSKVGIVLAGIQLSTVLSCLIYFHLIDKDAVLLLLLSIALSSPWYLLLFYIVLPMVMGGVDQFESKDFILMSVVATATGAFINAFILYLLGFLLTKAFNYLSSTKPKP